MTKWVVVTGASSGIGRAVAERFLEEGHSVAVLARRINRLVDLVSAFEKGRVEQIDIRDRVAVKSVISALTRDGDEISTLINNAGLSVGFGPLNDCLPEDWRTMIDTNIEGLLNCTHAALPAMRTAGAGHVINLGSLAGQYAFFGGNIYAATKAFVHHLSANLRVDLQGTGIKVTCVAPGMVNSEFALVRFKGDRHRADCLYQDMRPLSPEDVADAVLWAHKTPPHVNINYVELMSVDQPFGLALRHTDIHKGAL